MERSTLKRRGSCSDLQPAKALRPTLILRPKGGSPLLMLSPENDSRCVYNPDDDRVYETKSDLSGYRFLGSSGKWFLVVDSRLNLYIIDVFSEEKIDLPALESVKGGLFQVERVGEQVKGKLIISEFPSCNLYAEEDLRGLLWVDDKNGDYVVVWQFQMNGFIGFCKKGDAHYREIPTRIGVRRELRDVNDMVLIGYNLYVFAVRDYIRQLDLSGQDGFKDVSERHRFPLRSRPPVSTDEFERIKGDEVISSNYNIVVTRSGEVLLVYTYELTSRHRMFHLYKWDTHTKDLDPNTYNKDLLEVHSLGDEALFLDLGTTVPADHTLGIEPNSIYFTRGDRICETKLSCVDICVFNLTTKIIKRFPRLSNLNVKDAQWFLPS